MVTTSILHTERAKVVTSRSDKSLDVSNFLRAARGRPKKIAIAAERGGDFNAQNAAL
jgi:hypothetical protein